jgi:hypothetical protein
MCCTKPRTELAAKHVKRLASHVPLMPAPGRPGWTSTNIKPDRGARKWMRQCRVCGGVPYGRVLSIERAATFNLAKAGLVDCSVSFRTHDRVLLSGPGIQVPATPGPSEGMCKPAIVLGPTGLERVDQRLARSGINTPEIFVRNGTPQQCRWIEPAGVRRRLERPQAGMARHEGWGGLGDGR